MLHPLDFMGNYLRFLRQRSSTLPMLKTRQIFYLELRAYPRFNFNNITYELTNPELDDADRDDLINVFMGMPVEIADLPLNMNSGDYLGFVEGWTFSARYNQISISMILSPIAFSLQAMRWNDVPVIEQWNTINPTLDWINATIVA
jgi:hypothetical protein